MLPGIARSLPRPFGATWKPAISGSAISAEKPDGSKNNWWVALISWGEGWHNNHHAQQRSAAHGMKWYEFDITYYTILLMEKLGLAWKVVRPERPA